MAKEIICPIMSASGTVTTCRSDCMFYDQVWLCTKVRFMRAVIRELERREQ